MNAALQRLWVTASSDQLLSFSIGPPPFASAQTSQRQRNNWLDDAAPVRRASISPISVSTILAKAISLVAARCASSRLMSLRFVDWANKKGPIR
jgi:hypothetical protein